LNTTCIRSICTYSTRSSPIPRRGPRSHSKTTPRVGQRSRGTVSRSRGHGCTTWFATSWSRPGCLRCLTDSDAALSAPKTCPNASIHREVWSRPDRPSRVTESSFAHVRAEWPYRESLDCVVEAPDGRFAAYCLCWPDDENRVGEFEPVGVREEFRRRGLGGAVCRFALRRLHEEGGRQAIVYCATKPACALYESVGFRIHASLVEYAR